MKPSITTTTIPDGMRPAPCPRYEPAELTEWLKDQPVLIHFKVNLAQVPRGGSLRGDDGVLQADRCLIKQLSAVIYLARRAT